MALRSFSSSGLIWKALGQDALGFFLTHWRPVPHGQVISQCRVSSEEKEFNGVLPEGRIAHDVLQDEPVPVQVVKRSAHVRVAVAPVSR